MTIPLAVVVVHGMVEGRLPALDIKQAPVPSGTISDERDPARAPIGKDDGHDVEDQTQRTNNDGCAGSFGVSCAPFFAALLESVQLSPSKILLLQGTTVHVERKHTDGKERWAN